MTKILVATEKPFAPVALEGIRNIVEKAGFDFATLENYTEKKELLNAVADADALIIRSDKITEEIIKKAPNLKVIARAGSGYDNVDLAAATANEICVMNTPGQNANAVAELVFGMLIAHVRNGFNGKAGTELLGKKLGVHAYGNIGRRVARIAQVFGMEVYAYDNRSTKVEEIKKAGVIAVDSAEELYSTCQYISLHIPARAETIGSIGYNLLNRMPQGGTFVNTARQEVIVEDELLKLMKDRTDISYLSDIAPKNKEEYKEFEGRYFFTPKKMGAQTAEANVNAGLAAATQIVDFIKNGNEKYRVNK